MDTIVSRCQLIRFKPFSDKELELFIKDNLDLLTLNINRDLNLKDLIHSANGSPGKIINNIKIWNELPDDIKNNLDFPLTDKLEILKISKLISEELDIDQQIFIVNFVQKKCWGKTKNKNIINKLENLKVNLNNFVQPRLAWEVALLRIAIEDL